MYLYALCLHKTHAYSLFSSKLNFLQTLSTKSGGVIIWKLSREIQVYSPLPKMLKFKQYFLNDPSFITIFFSLLFEIHCA